MSILISVNGLVLKDKPHLNSAAVTETNETERKQINSNLNKSLFFIINLVDTINK